MANESSSYRMLERLQAGIVSLSSIRGHLHASYDSGRISDRLATQEEMEVLSRYLDVLNQLLILLRAIGHHWEIYIDHFQQLQDQNAYRAPQVSTAIGRPRFSITHEQLLYLHSLSFSWEQIADILGVSRMTIYRRRVEFGLLNSNTQTIISDEQLRNVVRELHSSQPNLGEVMVWGTLHSMGYSVTRSRLQRAIRDTDPLHTALRWRGSLSVRHPYSVPGPNSLWHIGLLYRHIAMYVILVYLCSYESL